MKSFTMEFSGLAALVEGANRCTVLLLDPSQDVQTEAARADADSHAMPVVMPKHVPVLAMNLLYAAGIPDEVIYTPSGDMIGVWYLDGYDLSILHKTQGCRLEFPSHLRQPDGNGHLPQTRSETDGPDITWVADLEAAAGGGVGHVYPPCLDPIPPGIVSARAIFDCGLRTASWRPIHFEYRYNFSRPDGGAVPGYVQQLAPAIAFSVELQANERWPTLILRKRGTADIVREIELGVLADAESISAVVSCYRDLRLGHEETGSPFAHFMAFYRVSTVGRTLQDAEKPIPQLIMPNGPRMLINPTVYCTPPGKLETP